MTDAIKKFLDHMSEWGCEPHTADDIIADDVRRYYRLAGDKPGVKKGSYVLRVDPDGFAVGGCMTMRDLQWHGWHSRAARGASDEEKAEWLARREAARVALEAQEAADRVKAVESARRMWSEGVPAEKHPYAARKHMRLDGLRVWFDDARMEDVLLVPVYYSDVALIAVQAKEVGLTAKLLGGDGWDGVLMENVIGTKGSTDADNSYFTNHYSDKDSDKRIQDFITAYKAKFNMEPVSFAALGYDTAYLLADAITKAGSTDKQAIVDAMTAINFSGITGNITFDENRNPIKSVTIIKIDKGDYTLFDKMDPTK